jgi:porin
MDGVTVPVELHYQPKQGINHLPGSYRLGVFYNNADKTQNKDVLTGEQKDHAYAGWFTADQHSLLWMAANGVYTDLPIFPSMTPL